MSVKVGLHELPYVDGHVHGLLSERGPLEPGGSLTPLPDVSVWPTLNVVARTRTGFTDEGAPVFTWSTVMSGETMLYESREEWDADAGVTRIRATARLGNDERVTSVMETAAVVDTGTGTMWRVLSSSVFPTHVDLELERIERQDGTSAPVPAPFRDVLEQFAFGWNGPLQVVTGESFLPVAGGTFQIASVSGSLGAAPSGGATVLDVLVNGVSVFEGDRVVYEDGASDAAVGPVRDMVLTTGDLVSVDVVEVAAVSAGENLTVLVRLERME